MKRLAEKVAIVTGGAGSIGMRTAQTLLQHGAKVALVGRSESSLKEAVENLKQYGEVFAVPTDMTNEDEVRRLVDTVTVKWKRIDILFNNAGVIGELNPIIDLDVNQFRETMEINVIGMFLGMKHVIPIMMQQNSGSIINTSSDSGWHGQAKMAPYCTSKHAVGGLTKTAAIEVGKYNIRVNAIRPTGVVSKMKHDLDEKLKASGQLTSSSVSDIPLGRLAETQEVANLVLFLASDESSFISGSQYSIDGGQSAETN